MSVSSAIRRLAHAVRHHRPRQLLGTALKPVRRKLASVALPRPPADPGDELSPAVPFPEHVPWNDRSGVLQGRFRFLNRVESLGWPVEWEPDGVPLLWLFHLHYFRYLSLLEPRERTELCRQWMKRFGEPTEPAWHPFVTSLRVVSWIRARVGGGEVRRSLYRQAAYLSRATETHLGGNHLLENARALVLAGCFFGGRNLAGEWIRQGLGIYRRELPGQILDDGGHFERSPMYHALVLEGCLDVLNVLPENDRRAGCIREKVPGMLGFLRSVRHPDGDIALFNDASLVAAPEPDDLLEYARRVGGFEPRLRWSFPDTGYYVHRGDRMHLVMDAGPVGPDHLPAHAHADIFSYELSADDRRLVVDSGVYEYRAGEMRDYVRSTRAHNTVTVDGSDQAEPWGSFRMGRRFPPASVDARGGEGWMTVEGDFHGFGSLVGDGIRHRRWLTCDDERGEVQVVDLVTGRGRHEMRSRVHLHPEVRTRRREGGLLLLLGGRRYVIEVQAESFSADTSWYCPDFGVRSERTVLEIVSEGELPLETSYTIRPAGRSGTGPSTPDTSTTGSDRRGG